MVTEHTCEEVNFDGPFWPVTINVDNFFFAVINDELIDEWTGGNLH